ncbi:MAG: hypothetical protein C0602_00370 [Denitrovibrio sp.]|nr:MAG: hypothetical protein C0602_00370 [Denitrovibrio sp.]
MKKILFLLLLTCVFSSAYAVDVANQKPNASKECAVCHYEWMPEFLYDLKGTELVPYQKEKVVATEKMCFSCHNGTVGDSRIKIWSGDMHKGSEKIPEHMTIPNNLPLEDGKVACKTCHTAHATGNPEGEGVDKSVFLRMENADSQLCKTCHDYLLDNQHEMHPLVKPKRSYDAIEKKLNSLDGKLGSEGQLVCESCHTPHSPKDKKLLIYPEHDSQLCSICHDNKVNSENAEYLKGMLNHPINIIQKDLENVEKTMKEGGVYGYDNEVICLTCHSPHKGKTKSLLIQKNKNSALCIRCHEKKNTVIDSNHDMHSVKGFVTKDGKTAAEKGTCESCHAPHGWSLKLPKQGEDLISKGCLSCHQEKGFAPKKVLSEDKYNHPVGKEVKDTMDLDASLPLFAKMAKFFTEIRTGETSKTIVTCATCHDVHSKAKNFLRKEASDSKLCITCHSEKKMIENTLHGQEKLKDSCLSCHKVHNCENKRLLIKPKNDGCVECHKKGGSGEKFTVDLEHSHPVNIKIDRKLDEHFKLTEDVKFTCVSCHDPHKQSKTERFNKDFLRGDYKDEDTFCAACHENNKEIISTDHDVRKDTNEQVCIQCHSVHKAKTSKNIMAIEFDYKDKDDSCIVCHNEKGTADKKVVTDGHKLGKTEAHEKYGKFLTEKDGEYYIYCSSCHTVHNNGPKKGEEGTIQNSFLNKKLSENGNFCAGCHEDKKSFTDSKHNVMKFEKSNEKTQKLKAEKDTCGVCHEVHNSGKYLFNKSIDDNFETICKSCHADSKLADKTKIDTSHKMNVELKKDIKIYLEEGKVVCATCHEPHAADKGMLRKVDDQNLCYACHSDQKMVNLTEHNLARLEYVEADIRKKADENVCYTCHKPHNFHKDNSFMWAFDPMGGKKPIFAYELCTDCHRMDGVGYKKVPEAIAHDRIFKIFPHKEIFEGYLYNDAGMMSKDGNITCQTCHDPHVWKKGMTEPAANVEGDVKNSFLKHEVKEGFCQACHGPEKTEDLFAKYHSKEFRSTRNKKIGEAEVMRNIMMIQMNIQKYEEKQ